MVIQTTTDGGNFNSGGGDKCNLGGCEGDNSLQRTSGVSWLQPTECNKDMVGQSSGNCNLSQCKFLQVKDEAFCGEGGFHARGADMNRVHAQVCSEQVQFFRHLD